MLRGNIYLLPFVLNYIYSLLYTQTISHTHAQTQRQQSFALMCLWQQQQKKTKNDNDNDDHNRKTSRRRLNVSRDRSRFTLHTKLLASTNKFYTQTHEQAPKADTKTQQTRTHTNNSLAAQQLTFKFPKENCTFLLEI